MPLLTLKTAHMMKSGKKYRNEVEFSIHLLDEWIGKLISIKNKQEISIIMLSSMGQKINEKIDNEHLRKFDFDFILRDQKKFLELALAEKIPEFTPRGVMVPQYSYEFEDNLIAEEIHQKICKLGTGKNSRFGHYTKNNKLNPNLKDIYLNSDLNENVVTVSVQLNAEKIKINNNTFLYSELGFEKFKSDSHHSGEHDKRGILWSNFSLTEEKELDYLNVEELIRNNVIRKCTKNL